MAFFRVKELCQEKGFNITQLSRKAEVSYPSALAIYNDKAEQVNRRTLIRIARALQVKVSDLFAVEADKESIED